MTDDRNSTPKAMYPTDRLKPWQSLAQNSKCY